MVSIDIPTPQGPAAAHVDRPPRPLRPHGLLAIGHGAGGGIEAVDIKLARDAAITAGWAVARVCQPYRVAGKKVPPAAPKLDEAWLAVIAALRKQRGFRTVPLVVAGRSSGARVACRTAPELGAAGVLCLAFPLHPPGRPDKTRRPELETPSVPVLVVQGSRDPFGTPPAGPRRQLVVIDGADHGLKRGAAEIRAAVTAFLAEIT